MPTQPSNIQLNDDAPTGALIREALQEARQLVRLEVALVRDEVRADFVRAKTGAILLGVAVGAGLSGLSVLLIAIALAFAVPWVAALVLGGALMGIAAMLGFAGLRALPTKPLADTTGRLESDVRQLKEHVA